MFLLQILAAVGLWKWADHQDEKQMLKTAEYLTAVSSAPLWAQRWNRFVEEWDVR